MILGSEKIISVKKKKLVTLYYVLYLQSIISHIIIVIIYYRRFHASYITADDVDKLGSYIMLPTQLCNGFMKFIFVLKLY